MARATQRLAKRQLTWFRADASVRGVDAARTTAAELTRSLAEH